MLGNHDLHLVARAAGLVDAKKRDTLDDVLNAPDCDELCDWLRTRKLLHRAGDWVMVHGGLPPAWSAPRRSGTSAAETALAGAGGWAAPGGHASPRSRRKADRRSPPRGGVRPVTSLRTLRDGTPDWSFKGAPEDAPRGNVPWFALRDRRNADVNIVFGHWSALGLYLDGNVAGIDTGCVWGHALTALRLDDRRVFQVPCSDAVVAGDRE